jgi:hypothetical protein
MTSRESAAPTMSPEALALLRAQPGGNDVFDGDEDQPPLDPVTGEPIYPGDSGSLQDRLWRALGYWPCRGPSAWARRSGSATSYQSRCFNPRARAGLYSLKLASSPINFSGLREWVISPHQRAVACTIAASLTIGRYTSQSNFFEPFGLSSMAVEGGIPLHPHTHSILRGFGLRSGSIRDAKVPPYKTALKATICSADPPTEG